MFPTDDLFEAESRALAQARAVHTAVATDEVPDAVTADESPQRKALGELINSFERLLRETRRLVRRSDREELEMNRLNQRLHDLANELEFRATHDSLTGVLNRAAIIERSNRSLTADGLALIVLDIDHFKRVNDSFGHPVGDAVICGVVECLKTVVPPLAQIGRVGGEEFTVLLPRHSIEEAAILAERLRQAVAAHPFGLLDHCNVTASFGVSWLPRGSSFDDAYGRADAALYAAKREGRNRVARADQLELAAA